MAKKNNEKINELVHRYVSEIVQFELKDPKVGFVTITDAEVTSDLSYAKIYVSFLGKQERAQAGLRALERSKGYIRSLLGKKLSTRKVPELIFVLDDSLERGNRIDRILEELNKESD